MQGKCQLQCLVLGVIGQRRVVACHRALGRGPYDLTFGIHTGQMQFTGALIRKKQFDMIVKALTHKTLQLASPHRDAQHLWRDGLDPQHLQATKSQFVAHPLRLTKRCIHVVRNVKRRGTA